jgi:HlyD family secretion protein
VDLLDGPQAHPGGAGLDDGVEQVKKALIIGGAVILLAVIVISSLMGGGAKGQKVYAEKAVERKIESVVTAPGEVNPKVKVNISANVIAKIVKLHFNEGDTVRRGQVLVDLERPSYEASRNRAQADLASRRIEVERSRAALGNADLTYKRAESLRRQGIQAQELFDRAKLELDNARAAYASSQEGVRQAQAMVQEAQTALSYTTIVSPMDGRVVSVNAHEGEVVVTGTMNNPGSVIAIIADLSQILVEAEVGETEVVGIALGQPAKVKVDAVADKEYKGHVAEIGSSAAVRQGSASTVRYFKVKVAIDDPDDRLRPGMTSQVAIITSTSSNAVAVPIQCVVERVPGKKADDEVEDSAVKKKYVFVVAGDSAKGGAKAKMVEVKTGISDATHVSIVSGLKAGEQVLTGPFKTLKKLNDGDEIEVTKEEKKAATTEEKK